jgi:hypothetical protein
MCGRYPMTGKSSRCVGESSTQQVLTTELVGRKVTLGRACMLEVYIATGKRRILQKGSDNSTLQQSITSRVLHSRIMAYMNGSDLSVKFPM